jgi:hypothetical protein
VGWRQGALHDFTDFMIVEKSVSAKEKGCRMEAAARSILFQQIIVTGA